MSACEPVLKAVVTENSDVLERYKPLAPNYYALVTAILTNHTVDEVLDEFGLLNIGIYSFISINGIAKTVKEWAKIAGLRPHTMIMRYKRGDRGERLLRPAVRRQGKCK